MKVSKLQDILKEIDDDLEIAVVYTDETGQYQELFPNDVEVDHPKYVILIA